MSHYTEMQCSICGWEPRPMGESNLYYTFGSKEFHERMRTHYEWHRAKVSAGEPGKPEVTYLPHEYLGDEARP